MNEHNSQLNNQFGHAEVLNFPTLIGVLWNRRFFYIVGFLLISLIGALTIFLAPKKFRSEAFFHVGTLVPQKNSMNIAKYEKAGMPIPIFKDGERRLYDLNILRTFMDLNQTIGRKEQKSFSDLHGRKEDIKRFIVPITNHSKISRLSQEEGSTIVGFEINYMSVNPEVACSFVRLFGNYVRQTYLSLKLNDYILRSIESFKRSIRECDKREIDLEQQVERLKRKKQKLESLAKRFPRFGKTDELFLEKIANPNSHYMTPSLQLKALESQLLEIEDAIDVNAMKRNVSDVSLDFFVQAEKLLNMESSYKPNILAKIDEIKNSIFTKKRIESPSVLYAMNSITMEIERLNDIYFGVFGFASDPTAFLENTFSDRVFRLILFVFVAFILLVGVTLMLSRLHRGWTKMQKGFSGSDRIEGESD